MSNSSNQPYKYICGDRCSLTYIEQSGKLIMSLFDIVEVDGQWMEAAPFVTTFSITKYGGSGCQVSLDGYIDGLPGGSDNSLILFFNSQIDWAQPLVVESFLPSGSVFTFIPGFNLPPESFPVNSLVLVSSI